jgi:hypothetical protein
VDAAQLTGEDRTLDSLATLSSLEARLIVGGVSKQTHDSIATQIEDAKQNNVKGDHKGGGCKPDGATRPGDINMIAGLLLGSPEFQRR